MSPLIFDAVQQETLERRVRLPRRGTQPTGSYA